MSPIFVANVSNIGDIRDVVDYADENREDRLGFYLIADIADFLIFNVVWTISKHGR